MHGVGVNSSIRRPLTHFFAKLTEAREFLASLAFLPRFFSEIEKFRGHHGSIDCIALLNDVYFVSGGDDGAINFWSTKRKKPICVMRNAHAVSFPLIVHTNTSTGNFCFLSNQLLKNRHYLKQVKFIRLLFLSSSYFSFFSHSSNIKNVFFSRNYQDRPVI